MTQYLVRNEDGAEQELAMLMPTWVGNTDESHRQANKYTFWLWMFVIGILAGVVFLFGYWAWKDRSNGDVSATLMVPATTALGAIVGLLAPGPTTKT